MLKRKHDFKPDRMGAGALSKLYLTRRQRLNLLRWLLYGAVILLLSLMQDVILCRIRIFGVTTNLVGAGILLLSMMLQPDAGAVFALISSVLYYFSGAAPGPYAIVFLTGLGVLLNIFRYSYLRKGFGSAMLCAGAAMMLYEVLTFGVGLFLGHTTVARFAGFCITGGLSAAVMPLLYPLFVSIGKIGGESWKE